MLQGGPAGWRLVNGSGRRDRLYVICPDRFYSLAAWVEYACDPDGDAPEAANFFFQARRGWRLLEHAREGGTLYLKELAYEVLSRPDPVWALEEAHAYDHDDHYENTLIEQRRTADAAISASRLGSDFAYEEIFDWDDDVPFSARRATISAFNLARLAPA